MFWTHARFTQVHWTLIGVFSLLVVGCLDRLTGAQVSILLFYLVPIAWTTWFGSHRAANVICGCSALTRFLVEWQENTGFETNLVVAWNLCAELGFFWIFTALLMRLKLQLERERSLARMDTLSQLHNVRSFREGLEGEIERCRRYGRPFSLVYLDLDFFKQVNDTMGHAAGDEVLCLVAQVLRENSRHVDIVARLGGDEFAMILPETGAAGTWALLNRIRTKLGDLMSERGYPVTASIGAVAFSQPPADVADAQARADEAMYESKRGGRDRIEVREHAARDHARAQVFQKHD